MPVPMPRIAKTLFVLACLTLLFIVYLCAFVIGSSEDNGERIRREHLEDCQVVPKGEAGYVCQPDVSKR